MAAQRANKQPPARTLSHSLPLLLGLLVAGSAAAATPPSAYGESPMVKVRPGAAPHADRGAALTGARNEFVSLQVVVHGGSAGLHSVRAIFAGLTGPATIGGADVSLYRETLLTIATPSVPDPSLAGPWPDGLLPDVDESVRETRSAFPFDVSAGESRAIWVDIHIPFDAPAGDYGGQVGISADAWTASVAVTLRVLNVALPSTASLPSAFRLQLDRMCEAHTGSDQCNEDWALRDALTERYKRLALEHRVTLSNAVPQVPDTNDWAHYDALTAPFLDGTSAARLPGARATTLQYTGTRASAVYAAFAKHLREKGWLERAYDYTGDEPPFGISFEQIAANAAIVRAGDRDLRTMVTTSVSEADAHALTGLIDTLAPVINQLDGLEAPYRGDQRPAYDAYLTGGDRRLWVYQSCLSHGCSYGTNQPGNGDGAGWPSYMVDASAARNRAMQWLAFLERANGELYYETANALTSAWSDQYRFNGNGDGTLFYPGTPAKIGGRTDVPLASLRLKMIRMGMQDYEWLKLVSDAGDPVFADATARALIPSASSVPDDGIAFERARLALIQRLAELGGMGTPTANQPPTSTASAAQPAIVDGSPTSGGCTSAPAGAAPLGLVLSSLYWSSRRRRARRPPASSPAAGRPRRSVPSRTVPGAPGAATHRGR